MSTTILDIVRDTIEVPSAYTDSEEAFRTGYRAGRDVNGEFRLNMEAMRYEPIIDLSDRELCAWTEGFREGYLARRAAGELLRY